jgi:hypothetical protein
MKKITITSPQIIIVIIFVCIVLSGVGAYLLSSKEKKQPTVVVKSDCQSQQSVECNLLNEGITILAIEDSKELMDKKAKIDELSRYTANANLMYLVTAYYIKIEDPSSAIKFYDFLKKSYAATNGYDASLEPFAQAPNDLQERIDYMVKIQQTVTNNSTTSREPQ